MPEESDESVASRLGSVRKRLQRRKKAKRAEERAEARSEKRGAKARERAERERRIERNNPETAAESVAASGKEVKLIASELGISTDRARNVIDQGSQLIAQAESAGSGALDQLDTDGDGDTDILSSIEGGVEVGQRRSQGGFEPPVGGVEDDIEDLDGIEEELGLDQPIEEQQDGGLF
jgi:hypothetical protein